MANDFLVAEMSVNTIVNLYTILYTKAPEAFSEVGRTSSSCWGRASSS